MKLNAYTIHDSASGVYSRPFFAQADGAAVREFSDIANSKEHPVGKHPEHYKLFRTGIFNETTGELTPEILEHLANGHDLVEPSPQQDLKLAQ
ncbi:nonstructural protein [Microviridae sp.]|nr:nonstructural protein [Microviridae sp.]